LWADYGKDFYASTSFNDIPASDGRRIWIGWFSNWQYAKGEPTSPFRCIQSIPRVLKFKETADGIRLVQEPIAELKKLREEQIHIAKSNIAGANSKLRGFRSDSYEVLAKFDGNITFKTRKGPTEETAIGYDGELYVDRRKSGITNFSKDFPGIHRAPLKGERILHIFVDRSSVEVFGGDGEAVISDRIFPSPESNALEITGTGKLVSLDIWKLKSIW
jgi:fructan beta-fructosidase